MPRSDSRVRAAFAAALLAPLAACGPTADASGAPEAVPTFAGDPTWPTLPAHWVVASGIGLFIDDRDHVWFSHRAELATEEYLAAVPGGIPAPQVMEIDPGGNVTQTWEASRGTPGWPDVLHGWFVDHAGFIWTTARDQHQVFKLTREGERVLTIGIMGETGGSADLERLGRPADVWVDPETNEAFVVDGYDNRRVIVFDGDTGAYLRHWGAYGDEPDDGDLPDSAAVGSAPPRQFDLVHSIAGSRDGRIYVADQTPSRIQVFDRSGRFVAEKVLRAGQGAATAVALSRDPEERFLYVADGTEHVIRILRREDLEIVGSIGGPGRGPMEFGRPHNLALDAGGNLYVAEADPGRRVQKLTFQGMVVP